MRRKKLSFVRLKQEKLCIKGLEELEAKPISSPYDIKDLMMLFFKQSKTKNGVRKVPVSREVMNKITIWVRYQRREMVKCGLHNPDRLIFLNYKGKIPPASSINLTYKRLQKRLGSPGIFSTHTMRHTIASMMLNSGEISLVYISRFLGHSNISITQKYYIDLLPDQVTNEDEKVVKLLALAILVVFSKDIFTYNNIS